MEIDSIQTNSLEVDGNIASGGVNDNLFINGNFDIWQRGTSLSGPLTVTYLADRWSASDGNGNANLSRGTFTYGHTDVPGSPNYYLIYTMTSGYTSGTAAVQQRLEDPTRLSAATVTTSFWARVASGTLNVTPTWSRYFGATGSSQVDTVGSSITITTDWQKFEVTITLDDVTGKTISGGGEFLAFKLVFPESSTFTFNIAQGKCEIGSVATPFVARPIAEELALCQRYFQSIDDIYANYTQCGSNFTASNTYYIGTRFIQEMRIIPTITILDVGETGSGFNGITTGSISVSARVTGIRWNVDATTTSTAPGSVSISFEADAEL